VSDDNAAPLLTREQIDEELEALEAILADSFHHESLANGDELINVHFDSNAAGAEARDAHLQVILAVNSAYPAAVPTFGFALEHAPPPLAAATHARAARARARAAARRTARVWPALVVAREHSERCNRAASGRRRAKVDCGAANAVVVGRIVVVHLSFKAFVHHHHHHSE
jgi:hypothetical protein